VWATAVNARSGESTIIIKRIETKRKNFFFFVLLIRIFLEELRHLHFLNLFDAGIAFDDLVKSKNEEERKIF
jgi:hypothetical protein